MTGPSRPMPRMPVASVLTADRGSILIPVLALMLILGFVSLELATLTGFGVRNTVLSREAVQMELGARATLEYGIWKFKNNVSWRTSASGETHNYAGTAYILKALNCTLPGYGNCVVVTAQAPGSTAKIGMGVRYPVYRLIIADTENQRIRKVDLGTNIITTAAGIGTAGFSGDGGPGTSASVNNPLRMVPNSKNELLFADTENHMIRKINSDGIITTVAGKPGPGGYGGDAGPATSATLFRPKGVAVDPADNLYIADTENQRIRRVDAMTGIITTVAGTGAVGISGDNQLATLAWLNYPGGIALDSVGNLYISDTQSHRIRRVDAVTGIINTHAGSGVSAGYSGDGGLATSSQLNFPAGLRVGPANHLYIADTYNHCIRQVNSATGIITTVAGQPTLAGYNGDSLPATSALLNLPQDILMTSAGDLYIADTGNYRIRKVDAGTGLITTVAGTGSAGFNGDDRDAATSKLTKPAGVAFMTTMELVPKILP